MVPKNFAATAANFPDMKDVIIGSARLHVEHGHNLVMDIVCPEKPFSGLSKMFNDSGLFTVGLKADLEILKARELQRGDRNIGLAESQFSTLHNNIKYDLEINTTTTSAEQSAEMIIKRFLNLE